MTNDRVQDGDRADDGDRPHTDEALIARAGALASELTANEVDLIALNWVDNAGITRAKTIPTTRLPEAATVGVGMSPVFDVFCVDDSITNSAYLGGPVDDLRLYPDLDRLVQLTAQPGWAWAPVDRRSQDHRPHSACSRSFARRMVDAAAKVGLTFQMAFETEWCVGEPTDDGGYRPIGLSPAYGMTRVIELSDYLRDIVAALSRQGIEVHQIHPEYVVGQLELSVAPSDPITAADHAVLVRQTIRAVSEAYQLRPSFAPIVGADLCGSGWHLHMSPWFRDPATPDDDDGADRDPVNLLAGGSGPYGLSDRGDVLVAALLRHLPALSAITAPSVSSRLRLVPGRWAGPFQCWGWENREAAIRLVTGNTGTEASAANVELKCVDGSANPYLVVGAVAVVASAAIQADPATVGRLPQEVGVDPATMSPENRPPRLPETVAAAVARLRADPVLTEALGAPLLEAFIAVHEAEAATLAGHPVELVAARTRWRY